MFRLASGRSIVGHASAEEVRGELLTDGDENEARNVALQLSERFAEMYAEDELEFAETC